MEYILCIILDHTWCKGEFFMADLSSSNVGTHQLHVIKDLGDTVIGYYMIIGHGLMLQTSNIANFMCNVL